MILIYTGNGKGKTSACVGQTMRALGQGFKIVFAQFMKRADQAGEQKQMAAILGDCYYAGGKGFFRNEEERAEQEQAAQATLDWAKERMDDSLDLLVLDESIYALDSGLLTRKNIEEVIELAGKHNFHVVLSGRNAPDWLVEAADLVTEMREIKHPWTKGIKAAKGIEF